MSPTLHHAKPQRQNFVMADALPVPTLAQLVEDYTRQAIQPGWWAYTKAKVREIEMDPRSGGMYRGLYAQVRAQVLATGYRPHPSELGDWWLCPSPAERAYKVRKARREWRVPPRPVRGWR